MATIEQLLATEQEHYEAAKRRKAAAIDESKRILDSVKSQNRMWSGDEKSRVESLRKDIERAKGELESISSKLAEMRKIKAEEDQNDAASRALAPNGWRAPQRPSFGPTATFDSVVQRDRTYSPDSDPNGIQFATDVARAFKYNDRNANARLDRHSREMEDQLGPYMQRAAGDATTTEFAGLVVPQYLVDLAAPDVAARRPFLDAGMNRHPLPAQGMSLEISKGGSTAAELQTAELAGMGSPQTYDDTKVSVPVQTALATQNVSLQAIQRGSGIESLLMSDLQVRVASLMESTVINQATTGLDAIGTTVAYTSGTPAVDELYPIILQAQAGVETALLGTPVDAVVMASRRWSWMSGDMVSTHPLVNSQGIPEMAGGVSNNRPYGGVRGRLPNGLNVIVSANVPLTKGAGTNEDRVYVLASREMHLFEDGVKFIRAEQPLAPNLGVQLVVYSFFAYYLTRYAGSAAAVGGTGLIDPYA